MVTTIQLNENVKNSLLELKEKGETYEGLIVRMMQSLNNREKRQEGLLIEGCEAMAEENLKITKEFEAVENLDEWEW